MKPPAPVTSTWTPSQGRRACAVTAPSSRWACAARGVRSTPIPARTEVYIRPSNGSQGRVVEGVWMTNWPASPAVGGRVQSVRTQVRLVGSIVLAAFCVIGGFALLAELTGHQFRYFSKEPAESLGADLYV